MGHPTSSLSLSPDETEEWLDGEHVIFGELLEGKDVILQIEQLDGIVGQVAGCVLWISPIIRRDWPNLRSRANRGRWI